MYQVLPSGFNTENSSGGAMRKTKHTEVCFDSSYINPGY